MRCCSCRRCGCWQQFWPTPIADVGILALHHVDIFHRDRAAIAEVDDDDGEPNGRFPCRHGQHEQSEHLADQVAHEGREGDQVDVDCQQHQLDRHQDDDHVLAVEKDAEDAKREQDCRNREVMSKTNGHPRSPQLRRSPIAGSGTMASPGFSFTTAIAVTFRRATCWAIDWRFTPSLWRRVRTMAPIMATSKMSPAPWK